MVLSLVCSILGHKWRDGVCIRCSKKLPVHDIKADDKVRVINEEKTPEEILPTGRTFEVQMEQDFQKVIAEQKSSINPKFHRTEKEEDLSFNFSQKWETAISKYENAIYNEAAKVGTLDTVDENIEQCHITIDAFESFRDYCYKKSKGGKIYFEDMWECCHNSKNPCFSYIQSTKDYLNELTKNYESYKVRFEKESQIDMILLKIINNENGILQRKIYALIPEVPQARIRKAIDELVKLEKLTKEKKGSSYSLWLSEGCTID